MSIVAPQQISCRFWRTLPAGTDQEKTKQLQTYERSLEYANKAIAANANGAMDTQESIANGRIALFKGVWESLDLVKQTKADCEKAIALDPNDATAYYVFGRTHMKVSEKPRLSDGRWTWLGESRRVGEEL